jgi:hypothetical protein
VSAGTGDLVTYSSPVVLANGNATVAGNGAAVIIRDQATTISDQARIIAKLQRKVMVLETIIKTQESQSDSLVGIVSTYKNELTSLATDLMDL